MLIAELLCFFLLVLVGGGLLLWESRLDERDQRQRDASPSSVEIELDAMRRAAELRDLAAAAGAQMDAFIANREAEERRMQSNVVDGEVIEVRDEHERRWPQ